MPIKAAIVAIAIAGAINLAVSYYLHTQTSGRLDAASHYMGTDLVPGSGFAGNHVETDDGRHLLWAQGPKDMESGEWFDVTDAPLDPALYGNGIGKDKIPAIDEPLFVSIQDANSLQEEDINDDSLVIGYKHNGETKAYPIEILHFHELVNDVVGGKPVTVGW